MENIQKFYNALSWGIQENNVGNIRKNGFLFLNGVRLSTPDYKFFSFEEFCSNLDWLLETIEVSKYRVIFESTNKDLPRVGWDPDKDQLDLKEFLSLKGESLIGYNVSMMEMVEEIEESFCGTVITDEAGNVIIEVLTGVADSRFLTSTGTNSTDIKYYNFNGMDYISKIPPVISQIKKDCEYLTGYYEFAYGQIRGHKALYYTFYSDNPKYRNILDSSSPLKGARRLSMKGSIKNE